MLVVDTADVGLSIHADPDDRASSAGRRSGWSAVGDYAGRCQGRDAGRVPALERGPDGRRRSLRTRARRSWSSVPSRRRRSRYVMSRIAINSMLRGRVRGDARRCASAPRLVAERFGLEEIRGAHPEHQGRHPRQPWRPRRDPPTWRRASRICRAPELRRGDDPRLQELRQHADGPRRAASGGRARAAGGRRRHAGSAPTST